MIFLPFGRELRAHILCTHILLVHFFNRSVKEKQLLLISFPLSLPTTLLEFLATTASTWIVAPDFYLSSEHAVAEPRAGD